MNNIPEDAIIIPDKQNNYMAVWTDNAKLKFRLLDVGIEGFDVVLDKTILPYLVDALIELQNR